MAHHNQTRSVRDLLSSSSPSASHRAGAALPSSKQCPRLLGAQRHPVRPLVLIKPGYASIGSFLGCAREGLVGRNGPHTLKAMGIGREAFTPASIEESVCPTI